MMGYLGRRLLMFGPTVLGVATVVFFLVHLMPGDPVDMMLGETAAAADRVALRRSLGLDRPVLEQFARFLAGLAHGDLGISVHSGRPVADLVLERYPATLALTGVAMCFAIVLAVPAGVLSARRPGSALDRAALTASLLGVALPNFWLGPLLILLFSVQLGMFPVSGADSAAHVVLPALTLGASMAGILTRMTRAAVLEQLGEDYIRTARAKGLGERAVMMRHALRNALTPLLSVIGLQFGSLLAGSVITETIFAWPGIGRLTVQAIETRDYPVVQGCVLAIALGYVVANLITDLAYARVNPRISYGDDS